MRYPVLLALCLIITRQGFAAVLDPESPQNSALMSLQTALDEAGIDVAKNLNLRAVIGIKILRPRLGAFPDLPINTLPDSEEINSWEKAYLAGDIAAIVFSSTAGESPINPGQDTDYDDFLQSWLELDAHQRVFITIYKDDYQWNQSLLSAIQQQGYVARHYTSVPALTGLMDEQARSIHIAQPGRLYATAGQRWALDSKAARRARTGVKELDFLGVKVRRNTTSTLASNNKTMRRIARSEPSIFRKNSLGDEIEASTIREITVPGGIALGEKASIEVPATRLRFQAGELRLWSVAGQSWTLPPEQQDTLKSLFDFSQRAVRINSDSIVDIDEKGRIRISAALRNTDVGFDMVEIDTQPFSYVTGLRVRKSVIIDDSIVFFESSTTRLDFKSVYEVRFLRADSMRVAQTKVALVYEYDSLARQSNHVDSWGLDLFRLNENIDYQGLGRDTARVAHYAAWVALFRNVFAGELQFLKGRYEFMKIDKSGRFTPRKT